MDDTQLIALLRRKLREQDDAIHAFLDVLNRTGKERQGAWETMKREWNEIHEGWTPSIVDDFLVAYERTMPERMAAAEALQKALSMTFREAVLTGDDWTNEQRAYWIERCDQDAPGTAVEVAQATAADGPVRGAEVPE